MIGNLRASVSSARLIGMKAIEASLLAAFEQWVDQDVNEKYMEEQFFGDIWQYPPPSTVRKNGETAGNPRNIVDTGELYESGKEYTFSINSNGAEASWHWDAKNSSGEEYAWYVHEGKGPYSRAPRPWTDQIAEPYLFEGTEVQKDLEIRVSRAIGL